MEWCCWGGLNSRPQPYQGCALPLSYSSTPFHQDPAALGRGAGARYWPWPLALSSRCLIAQPLLPMRESKPALTREERLAAKLRENLRRRKEQARGKGVEAGPGEEPEAG